MHTAQALVNALLASTRCPTLALRSPGRSYGGAPTELVGSGTRQSLALRCQIGDGFLTWLAHGFRPPTPAGRLPSCDVEEPLRSGPRQVGVRFLPHPLPATPSARLTVRLPKRDDDGLTTFRRCCRVWVRPRLCAGGTPSAPDERKAPGPDHVPFGPSVTACFAGWTGRRFTALHLNGPCHTIRAPDAPLLEVAGRTHARTHHPKG